MTFTQTVDIPVNRRLVIDVPLEIPAGKTIITFTPVSEKSRIPISQYFGILSPETYGDGAAYQKKLRAEWDD